MNNTNLLKKYALTYLSKYDSTKKNLEQILKNKIIKMKNIEKNEKNNLYQMINTILNNLESNKIINDEDFAYKKLINLFNQGRSEIYIKNNLYKKGVEKNIIKKILSDFNKSNPGWEIKSAKTFAKKKKLGENSWNSKKTSHSM